VFRSKETQNPRELSLLDSRLRGDFGDWQSVWVTDKNISHFSFDGKSDVSRLVM
jgi:hypothetical protein